MKLLLDEHIPDALKQGLKNHNVSTVKDEGWNSVKNGELLRRMIAAGFDAFITLDTSLQYQQNLKKYPIPVIVLRRMKPQAESLHEFAPAISKLLKGRLKPGAHELFLNP